jgi:SAM-dependent methyltransferase
MSGPLYGDDLAFVQANGFGGFARAAIAELIPKLVARGVTRVIDVGCGAGVTTRALLEAGFETLAIEPSPGLLAFAREAAPGAEFRLASAYDLELDSCDAVLAVGEPLTYHEREADAEARVRGFFRKAARVLRDSGLLIFDLIETNGDPLDARGWASGPDWAVLYESREDRAARHLVRRIEIFRLTADGSYRRSAEAHAVRLFDRRAVTAWLEEKGFEVEVDTAYGRFALPPRRVAFTATRRRRTSQGSG